MTTSRPDTLPTVTGGRVLRRTPAPRPGTTPAPEPAPRAWRRVWAALSAALWHHATPEELYARQQRPPRRHAAIMTVGGHVALTPGLDSTPHARRAQPDLP